MKPRVALTVIFVLQACTLAANAIQPVTVQQLQEIVGQLKGRTDLVSANRLVDLHLTERLSASRLAGIAVTLPGEKSRLALVALADESQFLSPPQTEIPANTTPDIEDQRRIMSRVVAYVSTTIRQLPNFLATRQTTRFEDIPQQEDAHSTPFQPLHSVGIVNSSVTYRDGREIKGTETRAVKDQSFPSGLITWGEFGPVQSTVLLDGAQNKLGWLRWEEGDDKTLAVFSYAVPKERSHFEINYCCVADSEGRSTLLHELAGYAGEMAVDPATGVIYRIAIEAALKAGGPISRAKIAVEYGPVQIGGKTYICPVHGVALSRGQSVTKEKQDIVQNAPHDRSGDGLVSIFAGTFPEMTQQTLLNDTVFTQYHVFGSEARILVGAVANLPSLEPAPTEAPNFEASKTTLSAGPAVDASPELQSEIVTAPTGSLGKNPNAEPARAPVRPILASSVPSNPEPASVPEINVTTAARLPDFLLQSSHASDLPGFTVRTTSRLVDVSVVAVDKKGNSVMDLRPGDFEIYDNGVKQNIRYFAQEGETYSASGPVSSESAAGELEFSNQLDDIRAANARLVESDRGATILLIDASHLAFGDLTSARNGILRFLEKVSVDEPVGLYVLRKYGFEILKEPTNNHLELAAILKRWMPSAQDLAQAQEEEQRRLQQMEYVHNVTDLGYVNGNTLTSAGGNTSVDPQLRSLGDDPPREALMFVAWVARHLAAFSGHKTLIWITSDNVLANLNEKGPSIERGDKYIDPLALRARESLNEAHVSIYPLDASQLEAGGVAASVRSANVQLSPTANDGVQLQGVVGSAHEEVREALGKSGRDVNPGRITAQLQQDTHPIQETFRKLAEATGGRTLRRAGDIPAEMESIVANERSQYLLSFIPNTAPDGSYHRLTVRLKARHDITLRYRTGYLYEQEPATSKEAFRRAIWQPSDVRDIALRAIRDKNTKSNVLRVTVAATDLALAQESNFWTDRLDLFLIERDDAVLHAKLTGQILILRLRPETRQRILKEGLSVDVPFHTATESGALRIVVVDANSGRLGTLTMPVSELREKQ